MPTTVELMRTAKLRRPHPCACKECWNIAGSQDDYCHECEEAKCSEKFDEGCSIISRRLDKWVPVK